MVISKSPLVVGESLVHGDERLVTPAASFLAGFAHAVAVAFRDDDVGVV